MIAGEVMTKMQDPGDDLLEQYHEINDTVEFFLSEINEFKKGIQSIRSIENQAKMLSINATIETEHAASLLMSFENIVEKNLLIQAKMVAKIIQLDPGILKSDCASFCQKSGIEELTVTDANGSVLCAYAEARSNRSPAAENAIEKTATVARLDAPGSIRIKAHFIQSKGQAAVFGFGVVAREAKRLADDMNEISRLISILSDELSTKIDRLNCTIRDEKVAPHGTTEKSMNQVSICFTEIMPDIAGLKNQLSNLTNISRQLNLLGIRGAIEDAGSSVNKYEYDNLLNRHMVTEAVLTTIFLDKVQADKQDELLKLIEFVKLDEVWVTDENGVVELTNVPGGIGFAFTNEGQTAAYMKILSNPDLIVTEPPSVRPFDKKTFKFVGVGRKDKSGICQIGRKSRLYGGNEEQGFTVVSDRFKSLAEEYRKNIEAVEDIISGMRGKAQQALHFL